MDEIIASIENGTYINPKFLKDAFSCTRAIWEKDSEWKLCKEFNAFRWEPHKCICWDSMRLLRELQMIQAL